MSSVYVTLNKSDFAHVFESARKFLTRGEKKRILKKAGGIIAREAQEDFKITRKLTIKQRKYKGFAHKTIQAHFPTKKYRHTVRIGPTFKNREASMIALYNLLGSRGEAKESIERGMKRGEYSAMKVMKTEVLKQLKK